MQKPLFESSQDLANKYFIGTVINAQDPESKNRVRVKIEGMNDKLNVEALPWYAIMSPAGSNNNTSVNISSNASRVLVSFPDGDIYNGIVSFSLPQNIAS